MDISKKNEAVASKINNINASKMSVETTEVLHINNKENWAYCDDSILYNDWLDLDLDDEKKQSDTAESPPFVVTHEIPPKENSPSSEVTFASPKRKKTKFPSFDELLQNLDYDLLNLNFTKLLLFLKSSNKEQAFPFTLKQYEEFFIMIVEDVNILKSKSLDECYRDICDKISKAASGYLLTYVFEYKMDFQKLVMVIKKDNMMDQSEEATAPFTCSEDCIKASSQKSSEVGTKKLSRAKKSKPIITCPVTVSSGFKIHCLRVLLGFIKYDETKTKEFPELSPDQACYMQSLFESEEAFNDKNLEVKELCTALREVIKIYSLKYDFRIECVDSWKKNLTVEKIPKQKSGTDGDSNQEMNPKSENAKSDNPVVAENCFKKPEIPKLKPVQQKPVHLTKRMVKLQKQAENEVLLVKSLPPEAVSDTLNSIIEFLLDDEKLKLVFVAENQDELFFYRNVFRLCGTGYSLSNLGEEFERLHYRIFTLLPHFHIIPTIPIYNRIKETAGIKEVTYTKQRKCAPVDLDSAQRDLTYEKIPKQSSGTESGTETDGDSNQAMNPQSETSISETPNSATAKSETPNSATAKSETPNLANAKSETPDVAEHCFKKPEIPKHTPVQQKEIPEFKPVQRKPLFLTKRMLKRQIKEEFEVLVVRSLPPEAVCDTLNKIIEFLLDDEKLILVFVPKNEAELRFYRRVFLMCRTGYSLTSLGGEFERLYYRIESLLPRCRIKTTLPKNDRINETTGIKEVTYTKQLKCEPVGLDSAQRKVTYTEQPKCNTYRLGFRTKTQLDNNKDIMPRVCIDVEKAAILGLRSHFENVILHGCNFDLGQIIYRKVTYTEQPKCIRIDLDSAQSTPKKKKVNLKNVLDLAGTEEIRLASVIDLNQSLRNKKKNKKQKKAKLNKANAIASIGASRKLANKSCSDDSSSACSSRAASRDRAGAVPKAQRKTSNGPSPKLANKTWYDDSSSASSSRAASRDRAKMVPRAQQVAKRAANENSHSVRFRREEEATRKEQLMEALSVPVQSDRALRMMRGMGWSGGALGARGDGITEPLMPKLHFTNVARGAGLGHNRRTQPEATARKLKQTKTATSWVSEIQKVIEKADDDIIVKKTKDLLLENPTFDMMVPPHSNSKVELRKPINANVELSEPDMEEISEQFSRIEFLKSLYAFLCVDAPYKILYYQNTMPKKAVKFVRSTLSVINRRKVNYGIFQKEEFSLYTQIQVKFKDMHQICFAAKFLENHRTIELTRITTGSEAPIEQMPTERMSIELMPTVRMPTESLALTQQELSLPSSKANAEIITEETIKSYILSTNSECNSQKAYSMLKFKVLFLMNILNFVKSLNEESEVTFTKILTPKEKRYIQEVVDEVNMRINFGSTAAEKYLGQDIKKHVKDAFLGAMFNHQYTVVTLNKYFRFKRLNRPDNAVKRKCQVNFNLDIYESETVSEDKMNVSEPTESENSNNVSENSNAAENYNKLAERDNRFAENDNGITETNSTVSEGNNKVAENSNTEQVLPESSDDDITNPYDSDDSSVEEYNNNNATATVPRLPPGEEGVDLSNILYLYDKEKPNTTDVKNNSYITNEIDSKGIENINNKNNIGNGNINMTENEKNDVDIEMSEYLVCVDYTEEVIKSNVMTVDWLKKEKIFNTGNERAGLNDQPIKRSDTVANDVCGLGKIGVDKDNIEKIIDDVLSNTKGPDNQKAINDFESNIESWEDIVTDDIKNVTGNPSENIKDPDFIMKEEVIEKMEVISIDNKEDLLKVTNKGETSKIKEKSCVEASDDQNVKQEAKNLNIKTDGGRLTKENIVLSINNCDTQSVAVKTGTEIDVPNSLKDSEIELVCIVHINHPFTKLTKEKITEIQRDISNSVLLTTELPLLKCHGVQKDALIYTCHNKKTYDWFKNTISVDSYVKVLSADDVTKMAAKFYCLFDCHFLYVCKAIELYNKGLSTEKWVVEKTEKDGDYVTFIIKMDKISIKYIQESGFALFAGVDRVQFSPIWE